MVVADIVKWVLENRKDKVFKDMSGDQIALIIARGIENDSVAVFMDGDGIRGVVVGTPDHKNKKFHVNHILTTDKDAIRVFVKIFHKNFPGYTLNAVRKGQYIDYNTRTNRLTQLIYGRRSCTNCN